MQPTDILVQRESEFIIYLDGLHLFPSTLCQVIKEYWKPHILSKFSHSFDLTHAENPLPIYLVSDGRTSLYLNEWASQELFIYSLDDGKLNTNGWKPIENEPEFGPCGFQLVENYFYMLHSKFFTLYNKTTRCLLKSWKLPITYDESEDSDNLPKSGTFLGVDHLEQNVYFTILNEDRIWVYSVDGKEINIFGKKRRKYSSRRIS